MHEDNVVAPSMYNLRRASMVLKDVSSKSQCQQILNHIIMKGSLSPLEADSLYRVKRLASRVHDLKRMGVNLVAEMRRDATGKLYARYFIAPY